MSWLSARSLLVIFLLVSLYLGPYVYMYAMTQARVFPKIIHFDTIGINNLQVRVDPLMRAYPSITHTASVAGKGVVSWTETSYEVSFWVLHRIFLTWQNLPALLDVSTAIFEGAGVFNGTVIFRCNGLTDRLILPKSLETLGLYQSTLQSGNNTQLFASCKGPGPPIVDLIKLSSEYVGSLPVSLDWSLTALVRGDMIQEIRGWNGTQQGLVILPF